MAAEGRKNPRVEFNDLIVGIEIHGAKVQAIILDISAGGAQILLPKGTNSAESDPITVAIGEGFPEMKGQVRRSGDSPANPGQLAIGVQFEGVFDLSLLTS